MSFTTGLYAERFVVALEITPPQQSRPAVLFRRAGLLGAHADAINVIQRPDRQSSLDAALDLRRAGLTPVWHLLNRGRSRAEISADLATAAESGITHLLCLRGEHRAEDTPDTPSIRAVIAQAHETLPGAFIGATFNQYAPDARAALRNLRAKLEAGAAYVQTNPVLDLDTLRPYAEAIRDAFPAVRIIPMAIPLLSAETAQRIAARLKVALPDPLLTRLTQDGPTAGWAIFDDTITALNASGWASGVAIMTAEMDAPPATGERIVRALTTLPGHTPPPAAT